MENASKALIIAAAILLSILIIALGMRVYNSASKTTNDATLTTEEINAFNSKFLAYNGKITGTQVLSLISAIQSNNNEKTNSNKMISIGFTNNNTRRIDFATAISATETNPCIYGIDDSGNKTNVKDNLKASDYDSNILRWVKPNATYNVEFSFFKSGIVGFVNIYSAN